MAYTDLFVKKEFKIPTLVSLPIVLLFTFILGRFILTPSKTTQAEKKNVLRMEISNVYSNQATVFWQTSDEDIGWVAYGENKNSLNEIALDQRDSSENKDQYSNHYAVLKNLKENTTYYFKIAGDDGIIGKDKKEPFSLITAKKNTGLTSLKPAYGKIVDKQGQPLEDAVVLLSIENTSLLSTLTKSSGEWLIPLNYVLDSRTGEVKTLSGNEKVNIEFISKDSQKSKVEALVSGLNPVEETIIIGKNYSFLRPQSVLAANTSTQKAQQIDIIFPQEKAIIPDNKPLIKGTATPSSNVSVTLTDKNVKTTKQIKVGSDGQWRMTVTTPLAAGQHTLEVKGVGGGKEIEKTRAFTVAKSGEQVLGEATSEPTPTTSISSSPTPTPDALASEATPTPTPPVSGSNFFYLTLVSLSLIVLGLGLFWYGLL